MARTPVTGSTRPGSSTLDSADLWSRLSRTILRVATAVMGATVPLLSERLDAVSDASALTSAVSLWVMWAIVLFCVLVPSTVSLTALRLVAPAHLVVTGLLVVGNLIDDPSTAVVLAIVPTLVVTVFGFAAETGAWFVQASAYGDERRVPLRPPLGFVVVQVSAWAMWVSSLIVGTSALVRETWLAGGILVAIGVAFTIVLPTRFHRLSRRWLVFVPAGVVLHDHVALAETAMFGRSAVASFSVAPRTANLADLSGRSKGTGVAVELHDFDTVVLAATPRTPGGSALHVKSFWVRPSRPGRAISSWNDGRST